ncbi:MAG TPA: imidazole glycerol phosphate synthase subunit HisH [Candidatus Babeliaceae bacterium]|nr:imidazole glycerol phosphate synthase subunit HisH [Candidatus Babeliaceae bacterium]
MITIIDYGCGNIRAFLNAFTRLNMLVKIARNKDDIADATRIILPGVGAFDYVMRSFNESGLREMVERKILDEKIPVLGICAGMQILADSSEEGKERGLSWIPGRIRRFDSDKIPFKTKVPHMGWNEINPRSSSLFRNIGFGSRFYFVHSYYFEPASEIHSIAKSSYGIEFSAAVAKDHIYGAQFHPEKSHSNGLQLLRNFAEFC